MLFNVSGLTGKLVYIILMWVLAVHIIYVRAAHNNHYIARVPHGRYWHSSDVKPEGLWHEASLCNN